MLRVDPRQWHRLAKIIANLGDRITEARASGWLGEVQGLQVSLDPVRAKMVSLNSALHDDLPVPATGCGLSPPGFVSLRHTVGSATGLSLRSLRAAQIFSRCGP
jgi:hypothetical protein